MEHRIEQATIRIRPAEGPAKTRNPFRWTLCVRYIDGAYDVAGGEAHDELDAVSAAGAAMLRLKDKRRGPPFDPSNN